MGQDSKTYGPWPAEEEAWRGRRLALLQTVLLEHAAAHRLRTVMTPHQKVEETVGFAKTAPRTAVEMCADDASDDDLAAVDRLPKSSIDAAFYAPETGRHVPPGGIWSAWLCGDRLVVERPDVLCQFANGIDAAGHCVHRAFLASVRVLDEGDHRHPLCAALIAVGVGKRRSVVPALLRMGNWLH